MSYLSNMDTKQAKKESVLIDFNTVGENILPDEIIDAYLAGKKHFVKEIKEKITHGLQTSAVASGLFKLKLDQISINVKDMYLRINDLEDFESLVIIEDKDYYDKEKRWKVYDISREVNKGLSELNINFSLMPFSDDIKDELITSEGYIFKYGKA